jgi:hypothetical protein
MKLNRNLPSFSRLFSHHLKHLTDISSGALSMIANEVGE